jgi:hypothetical protein
MKTLTGKGCIAWLKANSIEAVNDRGRPEVVGDYEVLFATPVGARAQKCLARDIVEWVGELQTALLWLTDWPFYKPEEMALIRALRRGGDSPRPLIDTPGHPFSCEEKDELVGWVFLMMNFGWDGFVFPHPFWGSMFQTSHEDFVWITAADQDRFSLASRLVHGCGAEIYRETKI